MAIGGSSDMDEDELSDMSRTQVSNTGINVLEEDETDRNIKDNMINPNVQNDYVRS